MGQCVCVARGLLQMKATELDKLKIFFSLLFKETFFPMKIYLRILFNKQILQCTL